MTNDLRQLDTSSITHQAHKIELAVQVVIGLAIVVGLFGSILTRAYAGIGIGLTIFLSALLALVVTQLPIVIPWGRRHFVLMRSEYPWFTTCIAGVLVAFVLVSEHLSRHIDDVPGMPGPTGPQGPPGPQGIPGPMGPQGPSDPTQSATMGQLTALEARIAALENKSTSAPATLLARRFQLTKNVPLLEDYKKRIDDKINDRLFQVYANQRAPLWMEETEQNALFDNIQKITDVIYLDNPINIREEPPARTLAITAAPRETEISDESRRKLYHYKYALLRGVSDKIAQAIRKAKSELDTIESKLMNQKDNPTLRK